MCQRKKVEKDKKIINFTADTDDKHSFNSINKKKDWLG